MDWRLRDDIWFGLALLRPNAESANAANGGAFLSFFVVAPAILPALELLTAKVAQEGWILTSLEQMKRASDYFGQDADGEEEELDDYEEMAAKAAIDGLALGAFHAFPPVEQVAT